MLSILSCSKFLDDRENDEIKLWLSKSIPEHGEIFEEVSESDLQPGDVVLYPEENSQEPVFKHAAVYCGNGEIIHFQYSKKSGGWISKEGFKVMKKKTGNCQIYRKKGGIDLQEFNGKVKEAMNYDGKYPLAHNNCACFALCLLGLLDLYSKLVYVKTQDKQKKTRCLMI